MPDCASLRGLPGMVLVVVVVDGRPRHQLAAELSFVIVFWISVIQYCPLKGEAGAAESVSSVVAKVSVRFP